MALRYESSTSGCQHQAFKSLVAVTRLTGHEGGPATGYTADVYIRCAQCAVPFQFLGLPPGASGAQPMASIDGLEARLPIAPAGSAPNALQRMNGAGEKFDA